MKMFLLQLDGVDKTSKIGIYPSADLTKIESQYVLDRSISYFTQFLLDDVSFNGMLPNYNGEKSNKSNVKYNLCDMMSFIFNEPRGLMYVISPKFKQILELFNVPFVKFYKGSFLANGVENIYFVFHILIKQYEYIDFVNSSFLKSDIYFNKQTDSSVMGGGMEEVNAKLGSTIKIFDKAVMKPAFRDVDMYFLDTYQIVITDRLKLAIEEADLKGLKILPCPVEFQFSDEV